MSSIIVGARTRQVHPRLSRHSPKKVLEFLHEHRSEGATVAAINGAATNGHLEVVQWLTTNVPALAATTAAMDGAACAGHLDVVMFLHETRLEGCTTDAIDWAARKGHLEVWENATLS